MLAGTDVLSENEVLSLDLKDYRADCLCEGSVGFSGMVQDHSQGKITAKQAASIHIVNARREKFAFVHHSTVGLNRSYRRAIATSKMGVKAVEVTAGSACFAAGVHNNVSIAITRHGYPSTLSTAVYLH